MAAETAPRTPRQRRLMWALEAAVFIVVIIGINAWQSRRLLPADGTTPAPAFTLTGLDKATHAIPPRDGRRTVLYFFAPWCGVCHASIGNLDTLRRWMGGRVETLAIALDYETEAAVRDFAGESPVGFPILLGSAETQAAYAISAYPTYYVLDGAGNIVGRTQGYSTLLGLLLRSVL
jgi:thiol-disulfide isomerase/thioredoxin